MITFPVESASVNAIHNREYIMSRDKLKRIIIFSLLMLVWNITAFGITLQVPDNTYVTIERDDYGVPHISGESIAGVMFGQGFATARDRLYQMEIFRRSGEGTLSEIFGSAFILVDEEVRRMGYTEAERTATFQTLPEDLQIALQAYADGVNTYLDSIEANPDEYKPYAFADLEMEDWTPEKTIAVIQFVALNFGLFGGEELDRLNELQSYGSDWFDEYRQINDPTAPTTIHNGGTAATQNWSFSGRQVESSVVEGWNERKNQIRQAFYDLNLPPKLGSFAVLISEQKSSSGSTMLLGCPQMGEPSQYEANSTLEAELTCPEFHIGGAAMAGLPGVFIGRTDHFAWTVTSGMSDNQDVYIDSTEDNSYSRYWYNDQWHDFEVINEVIPVAGGEDHEFTHYRTVHGPVFADDLQNQHVYTMKSTSRYQEMSLLISFFNLWQTETVAEVEQVIAQNPLSFNMFFAFENGDINYYHTGFYQDRTDGIDPRLPHFGDGSEEWGGIIPFEALPQADVNNQDYFVNWNNKPVSWWDNGDNVHWIGAHGVTEIDNFVGPLTPFSFENLKHVPEEIYTHGTFQQAIDWGDLDNAANICPPGQSDFTSLDQVPSPHKTDQWELHSAWEFKEWERWGELDVLEPEKEVLPEDFSIDSIYPNPFNPGFTVIVNLSSATDLNIQIYNILGEEVSQTKTERLGAGKHEIGLPNGGLSSGVYFIHVSTAKGATEVRKMVRLN